MATQATIVRLFEEGVLLHTPWSIMRARLLAFHHDLESSLEEYTCLLRVLIKESVQFRRELTKQYGAVVIDTIRQLLDECEVVKGGTRNDPLQPSKGFCVMDSHGNTYNHSNLASYLCHVALFGYHSENK